MSADIAQYLVSLGNPSHKPEKDLRASWDIPTEQKQKQATVPEKSGDGPVPAAYIIRGHADIHGAH